jgi:hypothetical protein
MSAAELAGLADALTQPQRDVLGQALADAVAYRSSGTDGPCTGCDESPANLCADHEADLDKADAYLALGVALGIEVDW